MCVTMASMTNHIADFCGFWFRAVLVSANPYFGLHGFACNRCQSHRTLVAELFMFVFASKHQEFWLFRTS